ncbi:MAG: DUF134 domain-containing protein [Candidatus Omnitrophica bacterium]|nr:DUF134 domain-containing protein [Candidatus Omnitrophota bacterium]
MNVNKARPARPKGRPRKKKIVHQSPNIALFSPHGGSDVRTQISIAMEEYEALRLYDHMGKQQKEAAEMMGISQQSFSRILRGARRKVSDAIVNAKSIRIGGGSYLNSTG